jgi:cytidine deaminase
MKDLIRLAREAMGKAHAPYSHFSVGSAVETASGKIFSGCNVENASYGLAICAERNAIAAAIVAGERKFIRIAIVSEREIPAPPCGACRQVLAEFTEDLEIVLEGKEKIVRTSLRRLLPMAFRARNLAPDGVPLYSDKARSPRRKK